MTMTRVVAAAVLLVVPVAWPATAQTLGKFKLISSTDPITHADGSWIAAESADRAGTLVWKCAGDRVDVLYMFGQRVEGGDIIPVEIRFPSDAASASVGWHLAEGKRGASMPPVRVDAFTRQALRSPKVLFRLAGSDGKSVTSEFPLDGLAAALSKLTCAKRFSRPAEIKEAEAAADEEAEVEVAEPENPRLIEAEPGAAGSDWGMRLGNAATCNAARLPGGRTGVVVAEILSYSGRAFTAGLKRGDIILEINGLAVTNGAQAEKLLRGSAAGDRVRLLVCRNEAPSRE